MIPRKKKTPVPLIGCKTREAPFFGPRPKKSETNHTPVTFYIV